MLGNVQQDEAEYDLPVDNIKMRRRADCNDKRANKVKAGAANAGD
jgi:hypothetical protein